MIIGTRTTSSYAWYHFWCVSPCARADRRGPMWKPRSSRPGPASAAAPRARCGLRGPFARYWLCWGFADPLHDLAAGPRPL